MLLALTTTLGGRKPSPDKTETYKVKQFAPDPGISKWQSQDSNLQRLTSKPVFLTNLSVFIL